MARWLCPRVSVDCMGNILATLVLMVTLGRLGMLVLRPIGGGPRQDYRSGEHSLGEQVGTTTGPDIADQADLLHELLIQSKTINKGAKGPTGWSFGIVSGRKPEGRGSEHLAEEKRFRLAEEEIVDGKGDRGAGGAGGGDAEMLRDGASGEIRYQWEAPGQGGKGDGLKAVRLGEESAERHDHPSRRALIFTMDSLKERVELAKKGGPAGEIKIRRSLTKALEAMGIQVETATSDAEFKEKGKFIRDYNIVLLDPWTWAEKGWTLKGALRGYQHRVYVLDFFGADEPHSNLGVPAERYLTAFPGPSNPKTTFLGYAIESSQLPAPGVVKKNQGVIWGKQAKTLEGKDGILLALAEIAELHSSVSGSDATLSHPNIVYHGHLSQEEWATLLAESKFMIGLGDPLAGPSAVDAVVAGCAYLNPHYRKPVKGFHSQHPFLEKLGEPYVCTFMEGDVTKARACALKALSQDLPPMIPPQFTKDAYMGRVRAIFGE